MGLIPKQEREEFVSILSSDATLRKVVPEGTPGAVVREYEDSNKVKATKHELVFEEIQGMIKGLKFVDTNYGTLIQVTIDDEILSLSTSLSFGEDFMKKLPNIDLSQMVFIKPYAFRPEGRDKDTKGLSITQGNGQKIQNYFWDNEKKEPKNGMPKPDGDISKYKPDDWKIYFLQVRKFLINNTQEKFAHLFAKPELAPVQSTEDTEMNELADEMKQAF